jgi:mycothiol synthase
MTTDTTADSTTWLELDGAPAIDGLRFRRPRDDETDFEAAARVIGASNIEDHIAWLPTPTQLREEFEGSTSCVLGQDVVLAEVRGEVVAEAAVDRAIRDRIAVFHISGHVLPEYRRRGLGSALLRENLRRAAERGAQEPDGQAFEARGFADETETGHMALLEQAGFRPLRWFFVMRRPTLDDIPEAPLPADLEFRSVRPDQHRAIFDAEAEAFRDHWQAREKTEEDYVSLFRSSDLDTGLWVVAWDGDEIAGVVQTWIWADENRKLGVARGWLEHISVRRPWRRRGLGRAITAESLRRLRAAGMTEAMLGVDAESPTGALGLYEGLGFEIHQRSIAYRRATED